MSIIISDIHKSFKKRNVLAGVSLEADRQILTLLGPNGAGKTTLINIICGLLKCDSGEVTVCGYSPKDNLQELRSCIGLVTQETDIYEYLTARENLEFHARFYGVPTAGVRSRVREMLSLARLEERADERVSRFSGGMKRRLALVRAMMHNPRVLILDEPTLGIDVQNRNEIWNRILELRGEKTILICTNYMDEAEKLSDCCAIMEGGKILALDTPENMKITYLEGLQLRAEIDLDRSGYPLLGKIAERTLPSVHDYI